MSLVLLRRQMKYLMVFVWIFVGIFVLGAMFSFNPGGSRGQASTGGDFAKIGGQDITAQQFQTHLQQVRDYLRNMGQQQGGGTPTIDMYVRAPQYAWEQILGEYGQAAAAEAAGITVSGSDAQASADKDVDDAADRLGKGSTPEEISQLKEELRGRVDVEEKRRELLAQRYQDSVSKDARPVEVKVAHILIKTDKRSNAAALKLAEQISRQARAGADFTKLAAKYSEDLGSKDKGGEVGWASAAPDDTPANPKAPKDPNAAVKFNPEFTAAALMLRKGQVAGPVLSEDGFHILKALDERDYKPKPEPAAKPAPGAKPAKTADKSKDDPKKKEADKIQQYKQSLAQAVAQGIFSEYKRRLEAQVQPVDPWLQGYLLEEKATDLNHPVDATQKKSLLNQSTADYQKALTSSGEWGAPLAYHIADLYRQNEEYSQALPLLDKWTKKSIDPELFFLRGEVLEKLNRKTDAVQAYKDAIDKDYSNPELLTQIADKLKPLGRKDLADAATQKSAVQTAKRAEAQKRQQAASQPSAPIRVSTGGGRGAKAPPVKPGQMIQVKTGNMNPKTHKPDILSVKTVPDKGAKPDTKNTATEKPAAKP